MWKGWGCAGLVFCAASLAMSGNPFGLSELSHYGSMQRVGGKAAGFINKKFFHPSSLRNQEKLWKAQTEHSRDQRKQAQLERQREEEMQVEGLRKQMYLRGQSTSKSDLFTAAGSKGSELLDNQPMGDAQLKEQKRSYEEFKRRKGQLKQAAAAAAAVPDDHGEEAAAAAGADEEEACELPAGETAASSSSCSVVTKLPPLAKSVFREDFHPNGHESVWGSWFDSEGQAWGFSCCRGLKRSERCPHAPEEAPTAGGAQGSAVPRVRGDRGEPKGKRRRRAERREQQLTTAVEADAGAGSDAVVTPALAADGSTRAIDADTRGVGIERGEAECPPGAGAAAPKEASPRLADS